VTINLDEREKKAIEELSNLEHEQWVAWSKALYLKETLSVGRIFHWQECWKPYLALTEEQKEQDRVWARKLLPIIKKQCEDAVNEERQITLALLKGEYLNDAKVLKCLDENAPLALIIKNKNAARFAIQNIKQKLVRLSDIPHNRMSPNGANGDKLIHLWLSEITEYLFKKAKPAKEAKA